MATIQISVSIILKQPYLRYFCSDLTETWWKRSHDLKVSFNIDLLPFARPVEEVHQGNQIWWIAWTSPRLRTPSHCLTLLEAKSQRIHARTPLHPSVICRLLLCGRFLCCTRLFLRRRKSVYRNWSLRTEFSTSQYLPRRKRTRPRALRTLRKPSVPNWTTWLGLNGRLQVEGWWSCFALAFLPDLLRCRANIARLHSS